MKFLVLSQNCCAKAQVALFPLVSTVAACVAVALATPAFAQSPLLLLRADDPTHITVSAGGEVTSWTNEAAGAQVFSTSTRQNPSFIANAVNGLPTVRFNGATENDVLRSLGFGASAQEITVFVVTTSYSNAGGYRAFVSGVDESAPGHQDFTSGFNVDQGIGSTSAFDYVNFESAKAGGDGGQDFRTSSAMFGTYNLLTVTYGDNLNTLYVNGIMEGSRVGSTSPISLQDLRIGGRYYDNGGGPFETGFLDGDISEVHIYDSLLTDTQRQNIEQMLINKYGLPGAIVVSAPEPGSKEFLLTGGMALLGAVVAQRRRKRSRP